MNPDKFVTFCNETIDNYTQANLFTPPPEFTMKDLDGVLASLDRIGVTTHFLKMRLTNPSTKSIGTDLGVIKDNLTKLFRNYVIILSLFSIPFNEILNSDIPEDPQ